MLMRKYDLHTHTTASDGVLSPLALYQLAKEQEVSILAVTDHDTVKGIAELIDLQKQKIVDDSITLIAGAELTCMLGRQILHIVALNISIDHPRVIKHFLLLETLRNERAARIAQKLIKKNLPDILSLVYEKANGGQIGRPHFAKVLCDLKIVNTEADAFKKYLGAGKCANVSVQWPELEEIVEVVKEAGGVCVLAHPTKYRLTMSKLRRIIEAFKIFGGDAIEISYPGINVEQQNILKYEACRHELMVSAGSDFHTPDNKWTVLGRYPQVPDQLEHVLNSI